MTQEEAMHLLTVLATEITPSLKRIEAAGCGVVLCIARIEPAAPGEPKRVDAISVCDFKGQDAAEVVTQFVKQIFPDAPKPPWQAAPASGLKS